MKYEWKVTGMSCGHCVRAITQALKDLDEAATVEVNLVQGKVSVESSYAETSLVGAIQEAGYIVQAH